MIKKIIFSLLITIVIAHSSFSQDYKTGIGLRAGAFSGINIKHFIAGNKALEGIVHFRYHGFGVTGLYEVHVVAFKVPELKFYYGGGAHVGFYDGAYYYRHKNGHRVYYNNNTTSVGIDGVLGLEYKIKNIPFVVGIDVKPYIDFIEPGPDYWDGALNIRFVF